ncbi:MAG: CHAT domain-containing tetratricopeptide repeat protein [Bacteroidota bacterium]
MRSVAFLYIKFTCLLLFFLFPKKSWANLKDNFPDKWKMAMVYLEQQQMDSLWVVINEMRPMAKEEQSLSYGKLNYLLGEYWHAQQEWDKVVICTQRAVPSLQADTTQRKLLSETYWLQASSFDELGNIKAALENYQNCLAVRRMLYGANHKKVSDIHFNIGVVLQQEQSFLQSDNHFLAGLQLLITTDSTSRAEHADFYEELGFNAFQKEDFITAIDYLEKAVQIRLRENGERDGELVVAYDYLGRTYRRLENDGKAIDCFNKALAISKMQMSINTFDLGMLNLLLGKSHLRLKNEEKAFFFFEEALRADKQNRYLSPEIHRVKGEWNSTNGRPSDAEYHFNLALKEFRLLRNPLGYLVETYHSIVQHQIRNGNFAEALKNIDKVLTQQVSVEMPIQLFQLVKLKGDCYAQLNQSAKAQFFYEQAREINGGFLEREAVSLIQLKRLVSINLAYVDWYSKQPPTNKSLLKADSILSQSVDLVDYIIKHYQEKSTKEQVMEAFYRVFQKAVAVKVRLYRRTNNTKYLQAAFMLSGKSKNLILLQTLNNNKAFKMANVSSDLLIKEKRLRTNLTYAENKRFKLWQQEERDQDAINKLSATIFDWKQEYGQLMQQIEQNYPIFFQLKFTTQTVSVGQVQQEILSPQQTLIEYFSGEKQLYVFLLTKEKFEVLSLPRPEKLAQKVQDFRKSIYSYRPLNTIASAQNQSLIQTSNQLGFQLYQQIIQPFEEKLTQQVTIVADGALGYLPFDALLTEPLNTAEIPPFANFFGTQRTISHAYSVNWLSGLFKKEKKIFEQNFVGIAPKFVRATETTNSVSDFRDNEFRLGLGPLKYNQEEVKQIKRRIGGEVITGTTATLAAFLQYLQKGQILHLATHGKSNDETGDYSYLAFAMSEEKKGERFLYVRDLFNLRIPADLVVLSACETGLGEIKRGEGIVGIGKGFSYAGARSMISTLWRVSDNSTAKFMPIFYDKLKAGLPKDEALWAAKKEFVESYPNVAHPFYWSGYVAYGNMEPIIFQNTYSNLSKEHVVSGLLFLLLVGAIGFLVKKVRF